MTTTNHTLPDLDALQPQELKILILSQHEQLLSKDEQLLSRDTEIEHLKLLIAKLRRMQFGRKSEKLDRQIEQLELRLDELQATQAENPPATHTPARERARAEAQGGTAQKRRTHRHRTHRQELRRLQTSLGNQHGSRCPSTCRARCERIRQSRKLVPTAAANCNISAKTFRKFWSTCRRDSR